MLTSSACLRSGAGLVTVATPKSAQPMVANGNPSVMTLGIPETQRGRFSLEGLKQIRKLAQQCDVMAAGPGWGRGVALDRIAEWIFWEAPCPVVMDADGLNALSSALPHHQGPPPSSGRILTPHPGEFQRLWNAACQAGYLETSQPAASASDRAAMESQAVSLAHALSCVVLLKGARTLITDGHRSHHNTTGNPGLATAGSGDCLTGIVSALLAIAPGPWEAGCAAAQVHGLAGDLAVSALGQMGMTSQDLMDFLPLAWQKL